MESKVVSIIAPHQTMKDFFSKDKINKPVRSLHHKGFSTLIASNLKTALTKVKNTQKTLKCQKRNTCLSARSLNELEKQPPGSVLQNGCSEKFEKISRKTSVVSSYFRFYQQKYSSKDVYWDFFQIFYNTSERLVLNLSRKVVVLVVFAIEATIRRSCNKIFKKSRIRFLLNKIVDWNSKI